MIERTLEVFVKSWRTSNREILDKALAYETNRLSFCRQQNDQHQIINAESAFLRAQMAVAEYKSQTSRLVTLSGAVLGMVIAAVAFPVLRDPLITNYATVLAANAFEPGVQYLFIAADIILTGGLLGGGAEGIHRVISVFTDFIEKTKSQTDPLASQPVRQRLPDPGKRPERLPTSPKDAEHAVGTPPQR